MLNAHLHRHPVTRWTRLGTIFAFLALGGSIAGVAAVSTRAIRHRRRIAVRFDARRPGERGSSS